MCPLFYIVQENMLNLLSHLAFPQKTKNSAQQAVDFKGLFEGLCRCFDLCAWLCVVSLFSVLVVSVLLGWHVGVQWLAGLAVHVLWQY